MYCEEYDKYLDGHWFQAYRHGWIRGCLRKIICFHQMMQHWIQVMEFINHMNLDPDEIVSVEDIAPPSEDGTVVLTFGHPRSGANGQRLSTLTRKHSGENSPAQTMLESSENQPTKQLLNPQCISPFCWMHRPKWTMFTQDCLQASYPVFGFVWQTQPRIPEEALPLRRGTLLSR